MISRYDNLMSQSTPHALPNHPMPADRPEMDIFAKDGADALMSDMIFKLRVNQLVTTLRAQPLESEANTMLGMLESLVIAGEIPFADFMQRVQNLFPDVFDQIDPALCEKLLSMLND